MAPVNPLLFLGLSYAAAIVVAILFNSVAALLSVLREHLIGPPADPIGPYENPEVVVILVHGTWARYARWTGPDAPLRSSIAAVVGHPVRFQRFNWSGTNSVRAREHAAARLSSEISATKARWPQARVYLIGHSHGGNVVLRAFLKSGQPRQINGLIFLSTPFLTARARAWPTLAKRIMWWIPMLAVWTIYVLVMVWLGLFESESVWTLPLFWLGTIAMIFVWRRVARTIRRTTRLALEALSIPVIAQERCLLLRVVGDEASATLAASRLVSWIAYTCWTLPAAIIAHAERRLDRWRGQLVSRFSLGCIGVLLGFLFMAAFAAFVSDVLVPRFSEPSFFVGCLLVVGFALGLAPLALVVRGLSRTYLVLFSVPLGVILTCMTFPLIAMASIPLGVDLVVAGLLMEVAAESTPPGVWTLHQVSWGPSEAGSVPQPKDVVMSHGMSHSDSEVLVIVSTWLQDREWQARKHDR